LRFRIGLLNFFVSSMVCLCLAAEVGTEVKLHFPQFGGGDTLQSDVVLTNPSPQSPVKGRIDFFPTRAIHYS